MHYSGFLALIGGSSWSRVASLLLTFCVPILQSGGIINFILQDNKVQFEVNVNAAGEAGLNISSRLLALANIVE